MKLYTEEQVRSLLNKMDIIYSLEDLTPIELPSDEEIVEYIDSTPYYGHCTTEFKEGIEDGIKWMKEQILNQKK